ncbi:MAG TPA: PIN domain-containing protein [Kiritimatiellia bacterium]|nr:PIN domain-containing protein [Kiritimatiellia bacterium]HMO98249.1 PIN domain-containing protein [Kiritimatiellia bacterium]HMP96594.1 PIN domain-containing protein [Kiritimatiellia bacterium]
MILLDTNVLIYASDETSSFFSWARTIIAEGVSGSGVAINAITLAELCVGDVEPTTVADRIRSWGVVILDIPAVASVSCAAAYSTYRKRKMAQSGNESPVIPLPDFFIGAHASIMGWSIATADEGRFKTYFPSVTLIMP